MFYPEGKEQWEQSEEYRAKSSARQLSLGAFAFAAVGCLVMACVSAPGDSSQKETEPAPTNKDMPEATVPGISAFDKPTVGKDGKKFVLYMADCEPNKRDTTYVAPEPAPEVIVTAGIVTETDTTAVNPGHQPVPPL